MKLNYKKFEIEVYGDPNYTSNTYDIYTDNKRQYEKEYSEFEVEPSEDPDFFRTSNYAIIIKESGKEISSAIICEIDRQTIINKNSFIIEDNKIWICICNKIYCLEIPSLELKWQKEIDAFTNFSIYKIEEDFIVHGELEIFRITKKGEIIWKYGGRDIWVNTEDKPEIKIENNTIRLFDFESNEYVLDFNGNLIKDNPRIVSKWWEIFS